MRRAWILAALALFAAHACVFRHWIIDDAGISYVYARNLAAGYGLVAQPGAVAVEGYSNPAWVFFLALFFKLGLFHPVILAKVLGIAFAGVTFWALAWAMPKASPWLLVLLAMNTSLVVWFTSGLENPLLCALLALSFANVSRLRTRPEPTRNSALVAGVLAGLAALVRPDAALYVLAYPLALVVVARRRPKFHVPWKGQLVAYGVPFVAIWGGHLLFRWCYFGSLVPNTYYSKGGPTKETALSILSLDGSVVGKLHELMESIAGPIGGWLLLSAPILLWVRRRQNLERTLLGVFVALSASTFLVMPGDWMDEHRFATPFVVFGIPFLVLLADSMPVVLALSLPILGGDIYRSYKFAANPTVPFSEIRRHFGEKFNRYGDVLGPTRASFLGPDLGGTLYESRLRVYDMAGLCDPKIGMMLRPHVETKGAFHDYSGFHDYVFDTLKPTFIHLHSFWTRTTRMWQDPRFARDYVAIVEHHDKSIREGHNLDALSGDYVRRDALSDAEAMRRLRAVRDEYGLCWNKDFCDASDVLPDTPN